MSKDSKGQAPAYKEPSKIEDRKVQMAPEQSVKDGMAFFLRQEQEKVITSTMTDEQKFDRWFPEAKLDEMQRQLCVSGSTEDVRAFALEIFLRTRAPR